MPLPNTVGAASETRRSRILNYKNVTHKLIFLWLLIWTLSSCAGPSQPRVVKQRVTYLKTYPYDAEKFRYRRWGGEKIKGEYHKYDRAGNEIEWGAYGEVTRFSKREGGVRTSGSIRNYRRLRTVEYRQYDADHRLVAVEYWRFRNNKKESLISRTEYQYRAGQLYREVELKAGEKREVIHPPVEEERVGPPVPQDSLSTQWVGKDEHRLRYDSLGRVEEKQVYRAGILQYTLDYLPRVGPEPTAKTVFRYTPAGLLRKIYYYNCIGQENNLESVITYQYRFY